MVCQCVKGHGRRAVPVQSLEQSLFHFIIIYLLMHILGVLVFTFIRSWASARCDVQGSGVSRSVQEGGREERRGRLCFPPHRRHHSSSSWGNDSWVCVGLCECERVCVCVCVCRVQVSVCAQLWPRTRRYTAQRPTPHEHVICISQCAILLSYLTRVHPPPPRPAADPPSPVGRGCFFFVFVFRSGNSGPPPGGAHCYL